MADPSTPIKPARTPRKGRRDGVTNELSVFLKVKPGHERQNLDAPLPLRQATDRCPRHRQRCMPVPPVVV